MKIICPLNLIIISVQEDKGNEIETVQYSTAGRFT